MSAKNDGGPAFPRLKSSLPATEDGLRRTDGLVKHFNDGGMTLRDYFAAKAPPPPKWWMDCYAKGAQDLGTVASVMAQWAFAYADAMLGARGEA